VGCDSHYNAQWNVGRMYVFCKIVKGLKGVRREGGVENELQLHPYLCSTTNRDKDQV
jgi:hypothetical protein